MKNLIRLSSDVLASIHGQLDRITLNQTQSERRFERLESCIEKLWNQGDHGFRTSARGYHNAPTQHPRQYFDGIPHHDATGPTIPSTEETSAAGTQRRFEVLRDRLNKVHLPESLRVFDTKAGINKDCQPALQVVSKCARYTETALKWFNKVVTEGDGHITEDDLESLFTILHAEINSPR